ncbi:MAG: hypothetical protein LWW94_08580 [Candidatus Desulfofervidaceae bacterium]|nr:hypothetical protein [Candidatus Desulfofervidaceae bacterium]
MMDAEVQISKLSAKAFGSQWAPNQFLLDYGPGLTRMPDTAEFDFRYEASGVRIELKAARLTRTGVFVFQYIRPDCFDLCVCLGWQTASYCYWIFDAAKIRPLLASQHRGMDTFQLRIHPESEPFCRSAIPPGRLRVELDRKASAAARHRNLVRLDLSLATVKGWRSVAASISRKMKQCGLTDWQFVLRPLRKEMDEPELLPYPQFFELERRVELQVHPEPVIGSHNIGAMAEGLFDFLIGYLDQDEPDGNDAV